MLRDHTGCVGAISWAGVGTRPTSASRDKSIKIWDTFNGDCLSDVLSDNFFSRPLAWPSDGVTLVLWSDPHKNIEIWDVVKDAFLPTFGFDRDNLICQSCIICMRKLVLLTWIPVHLSKPWHLGTSTDSRPIVPVGYGIGETGVWITYRGERQHQLPQEHKIVCSAFIPWQIR